MLNEIGSVTTLTNFFVRCTSSYIFCVGLINYGSESVTGWTISGNNSSEYGGGLSLMASARLALTACAP